MSCDAGYAHSDPIEPMVTCDYVHTDDEPRRADWALIGEAGDFYICDEHYQMRPAEKQRGWRRING